MNWGAIPPEVFGCIVRQVGNVETSGALSLVCKQWRGLMRNPMTNALFARYKGVYHRKDFKNKRRPTHLHLLEGSTLHPNKIDTSWLVELRIDNAAAFSFEKIGHSDLLMLDTLVLGNVRCLVDVAMFLGSCRVSRLELQCQQKPTLMSIVTVCAAPRHRRPPKSLDDVIAPIPADAIQWNSEYRLRASPPHAHFCKRAWANIVMTNPIETISYLCGYYEVQAKVVCGTPGEVKLVRLDPIGGHMSAIALMAPAFQATAPMEVWTEPDLDRDPATQMDADEMIAIEQDRIVRFTMDTTIASHRLHFNLFVKEIEVHGTGLRSAAFYINTFTNQRPGDRNEPTIIKYHMIRGRSVDADGVVRIPIGANFSRSDVARITVYGKPSPNPVTVVGKTENIFHSHMGMGGLVYNA